MLEAGLPFGLCQGLTLEAEGLEQVSDACLEVLFSNEEVVHIDRSHHHKTSLFEPFVHKNAFRHEEPVYRVVMGEVIDLVAAYSSNKLRKDNVIL